MSLKPLRGAVEAWTPGHGMPIDPVQAIAAAWPRIVGPDVAAHCRPLGCNGTTLAIATDSSAWSQQLQLLSVSILAGIRALPQAATLDRLTFRTGLARRAERRRVNPATVARAGLRTAGPPPQPADDLDEAFGRLRRRLAALRRSSDERCAGCGAALDQRSAAAGTARCAPCSGDAERARHTNVQRLVYMAPWLTLDELREQLPGVTPGEFERVRRHLLQRWWLVLDRARRAGRVSASGIERHVGSSYVLLQSRLPPDRITPAVVRNLLGPELEKLLWPHSAADA